MAPSPKKSASADDSPAEDAPKDEESSQPPPADDPGKDVNADAGKDVDASQRPPATDTDGDKSNLADKDSGKDSDKDAKISAGLNAKKHKSASGSLPHSKNSNSDDTVVIIGVCVGVLLVVILAIVCVCCCKRKKKKPPPATHRPQGQPQRPYYNNSDPQGNQSQAYGNQNWYDSGSTPPGGWQMPPPPPMMSSDMSGSYSSGLMGSSASPSQPPNPGLSLGFNKSTFSYDELAAATQGFSQANLLGQGGFGFVHKGVLPNGKEVAVKSLKSGSGQGEREFQAEVEIISRVHHRHLVSLVGYCIAGGRRMLVYEFVPNGTLEYHLHGKGRPVMDFETRLKIALGSAKGLAYLHEDCNHRIIHRDIKTANILIDDAFEAKVADFGLAKLSSDTNTHVSTRVMGTFGYLAPEYAASGKLTDKSDVFSYGVMLLELVTGKRPIDPSADEDSLVDWARPQFTRVLDEGRFEGLIDPKLENNFNPQDMTRMVACAAASIRHSAKRRPKMSQIVRALEGNMSLDALNSEGLAKAGQSSSSSEYNTTTYNQDMKKFMSTLDEDYTSSEYGDSADYGRNMGGDSYAMRGARK